MTYSAMLIRSSSGFSRRIQIQPIEERLTHCRNVRLGTELVFDREHAVKSYAISRLPRRAMSSRIGGSKRGHILICLLRAFHAAIECCCRGMAGADACTSSSSPPACREHRTSGGYNSSRGALALGCLSRPANSSASFGLFSDRPDPTQLHDDDGQECWIRPKGVDDGDGGFVTVHLVFSRRRPNSTRSARI